MSTLFQMHTDSLESHVHSLHEVSTEVWRVAVCETESALPVVRQKDLLCETTFAYRVSAIAFIEEWVKDYKAGPMVKSDTADVWQYAVKDPRWMANGHTYTFYLDRVESTEEDFVVISDVRHTALYHGELVQY